MSHVKNVFFSWSGDDSQNLATYFRSLVTDTLKVNPKNLFISPAIEYGEKMYESIFDGLKKSDAGIVFLFDDNYKSEWLNFEAGAIQASYNSDLNNDIQKKVTLVAFKNDFDKFIKGKSPLTNFYNLSDLSDKDAVKSFLNQLAKDMNISDVDSKVFDTQWNAFKANCRNNLRVPYFADNNILNFKNMLAFWIKTTDSIIDNQGHYKHYGNNKNGYIDIIQDGDKPSENNVTRATNDPSFNRSFLELSKKYKLRIRFFNNDKFQGDDINTVVWEPTDGNTWFIHLIYKLKTNGNKIIELQYRQKNYNKDSDEFKEYMKNKGHATPVVYNIKNLNLESDEKLVNFEVEDCYNKFIRMIDDAVECKIPTEGVNNAFNK